jgi:hypothetical protein
VAEGRHRQARHRQPRRKVVGPGFVKIAIPGATVAMMATGSAVAASDQAPVADTAISPQQLARETRASRDALRPTLSLSPSTAPKPKATPGAKHLKKQAPIPKPSSAKTLSALAAAPKVMGSKYTTTDVNVWSAANQTGTLLTVLARGSKVSVTGQVQGIWAEIVRNGVARWVKAQYLSATKPVAVATVAGGISSAACTSGSAVENGLTPDAIRVHRAVCAKFPSVTGYGGLRSGDTGSEHATGHALDIMISGSAGQEIADWLHANYKALGISQLIWQQQIWTVQRSSEGWRAMPDRGSTTANHYDHVHVSVYGTAGTV